jgi:hypothetical protein
MNIIKGEIEITVNGKQEHYMATYTAVVEGSSGGERKQFSAKNDKAVEGQVREWVQEGDWGEPGKVRVWLHGPKGTWSIDVPVG